MPIDENKFKKTLSKKFIELLDSEHGIASELAKAIGKKASSINNVKRNRPVNALHLKAVEIIFGPEKVLELISENKPIDSKKTNINKQRAIDALSKIETINEKTYAKTIAELEYIAKKLNEGATPGPLILIPENNPKPESD